MNDYYQKVKSFVEEAFQDAAQILHFNRTVYWLQQLKPDADEALLISAMGHDVERAFREQKDGFDNNNKSFKNEDHLISHQNRGAEILAKFLSEQGAEENLINRVKHLVSAHEVGGDDDQNLLKDADSISFLENNSIIFLNKLKVLGYQRVKEKFDWMFERISFPKAKEIAQPFYKKIIKDLDNEGL